MTKKLLPSLIRYVFDYATGGNAKCFASIIASYHKYYNGDYVSVYNKIMSSVVFNLEHQPFKIPPAQLIVRDIRNYTDLGVLYLYVVCTSSKFIVWGNVKVSATPSLIKHLRNKGIPEQCISGSIF